MAGKRSARHIEEQTGELNLVPYMDIVVNLILFLIMTTTGLTAFGVINVSAPQIGGGDPAEQQQEQPLNLTVGISPRGFYVSGSGGNLPATGSVDQPTIPKINDDYDYAALSKKMVEVKSVFPRETKIIITGDPGTIYDVIVHVMDATRNDGANILFPDVMLSPGVV
jgi:biopolymer transport protein ExbD